MSRRPSRPELTPSTVERVNVPSQPAPRVTFELGSRAFLWTLGTVVAFWLFIQLWPILLVIALALMLVGALNPIVDYCAKRKMKRQTAVLFVFAVLFLASCLLGAITVPRVVSQAIDLAQQLPELQKKAAAWLGARPFGAPLAHAIEHARWPEILADVGKVGLSYSPAIAVGLAYFVGTFFLALYLLLDRDRMRGGLFALIPRRYHVRTSRVLVNLESIVGGYLRGQLITSLIAATVTFLVLALAHVPNALALAIFAGFADVLPYVGALLACAPAALAALSQGTTVALIVVGVLLTYQEIESRFIVPQLYGKVLRLPSASVMLALMIGGKLLGIVGALIALPIAAGMRMMVAELRVILPGEDPAADHVRAGDIEAEREFEVRTRSASAEQAAAIASEIAETRFEKEGPTETLIK